MTAQETEWGVRFTLNTLSRVDDFTRYMPLPDEHSARTAVANGVPSNGSEHVLVRRTVTEWEIA